MAAEVSADELDDFPWADLFNHSVAFDVEIVCIKDDGTPHDDGTFHAIKMLLAERCELFRDLFHHNSQYQAIWGTKVTMPSPGRIEVKAHPIQFERALRYMYTLHDDDLPDVILFGDIYEISIHTGHWSFAMEYGIPELAAQSVDRLVAAIRRVDNTRDLDDLFWVWYGTSHYAPGRFPKVGGAIIDVALDLMEDEEELVRASLTYPELADDIRIHVE